ncbi:hypothetical protein Acsp05_46620 [Actinokineospora sp. NBRC 105648]|nr:hypothetical protein Acsp05_46620 [Actinokineospora sp. NBRC 105648]
MVSDARRASDWFSFAERTDVLSGAGKGEKRRQYGRWGRRTSEIDQEVIEFAPPLSIAWKHTAERMDGKPAPVFASASVFRIDLEADGEETVVHLRTQQLPADGLKRIAMRVFGNSDISRRMEESLIRLVRAVSS